MNIQGSGSTPTSTAASCPAGPPPPSMEEPPSPMIAESNEQLDSATATQPTSKTTCSARQRNPPKNRSIVWDNFTKDTDCDPDEPTCTCNHCGKQFKCHPKRQGTSALKTHVDLCPKGPKKRKNQQFLIPEARTDGGEGEKKLGMTKYNEKKIRAALTRMVIIDELPFSVVEGEGFREFVRSLDPRFPIPSRFTVMRDCMRLFLREKDSLKKMFLTTKQRVSLTTDTWTSIQNINYMCVTAHFIDSSWKLHKRIISFSRIGDHKGSTIGRALEECMLDWGIDKLFTITVDNASTNDSAIDWLKTVEVGRLECVEDHAYIHMRCTAHILNLIVREGLSEVDESISKIRNLIRYVKSSPQRLATFKTCVERSKVPCHSFLCLDVPTRWNSTFLMLDVASKYKKALQLLLDDDPYSRVYLSEDGHGRKGLGAPVHDDWEAIENFSKFLGVFYNVTMRLSGTLYVTSNLFFKELAGIHKNLMGFCESNNRRFSSMALRMKEKYDKYWGNIEKINRLLFIAAILDPRCKLEAQEYWFKKALGEDKCEEFVEILKDDFTRLYEQYAEFNGEYTSISGPRDDASSAQSDTCILKRNSNSVIDDDTDIYTDLHKNKSSSMLDTKSELERYLLEAVEIPSQSFDILIWWRVNSTKYPILSMMAREILAIPITTVASESAFSTGGRILDPFRSSLAPRTVEALVCTQNWLKSTHICLSQDHFALIDDAESYKLDSELVTNMANLLHEE